MPEQESLPATIALVSVGNTNVTLGVYAKRSVTDMKRVPLSATDEIRTIIDEMDADAVALASVNGPAADAMTEAIGGPGRPRVYRVGRDLPIPAKHALTDEAIARTGTDRLLCALGAFATIEQACVVVDAGTAVTVDFVDGEGTFHGGAIAPGAGMQLRSLAHWTDALPELSPEKPEGDPIGIDTEAAMQRGIHFGVRGLVRMLTEQYALRYEAYPLVIATGGDAAMLFEDEELVDRIIPDLVLRGIARCCADALEEASDSDDDATADRLNGHTE